MEQLTTWGKDKIGEDRRGQDNIGQDRKMQITYSLLLLHVDGESFLDLFSKVFYIKYLPNIQNDYKIKKDILNLYTVGI